MNKQTLLSVIFLAFIAIFLFCGDDENGNDPDQGPNPAVLTGTWEDTIKANVQLGMPTTIVGITLSQGVRTYANNFEVYAKDSAKTTYYYKHRGTWQISNDTIALTGTAVEMWDGNGNPVTDIPDSVASKEYKLDTARTWDDTPVTWGGPGNAIQIQHLSCGAGKGVCLNIPFNSTFVAQVKATNLNFEKK